MWAAKCTNLLQNKSPDFELCVFFDGTFHRSQLVLTQTPFLLASNSMLNHTKKICHSALLLLSWCIVASSVVAQSPIAVLPYESENNRIRLAFKLEGKPIKMLLDSGATTTVLFTDDKQQFQSIDAGEAASISFPAMAKVVQGTRVTGLELATGGMKISLSRAILIEDKHELREKLILRYDGILGQEFFENYAIAVDPELQTLTLYENGTDLGANYRSHHRLYFQGTAAHVRFTSKLPWENKPSLKEMLLDTGYPGALVIWDKKHFERAAANQNRKKLIATNTGISSRANFRFGKMKFMNSPIFLGANPPPQITDRNGLMGAAVLNNFYYAIDFKSKSLWVSSKEKSGFTRTIDGTLYTPNGEDVVFEDFKEKPSVVIKQIYKFNE